MIDIILSAVIVALLAFIYIKDRDHTQDRRQLINAVLSKNSGEFAHAELVVAKPKDKETKATPGEFVNEIDLSDDDFFDAIKKSNE